MKSFISAFMFQDQQCTEICGINKTQVCHIIFPWLALVKVINFFKKKSPFCSKDKLLNGCEAWSTKKKS